MPQEKVDPRVYKMAFGRVISELRKRRDLSQEEFAARIGVSQPTLSRIERGMVLPDAFTYKVMAEELGLTVGEVANAVDDAVKRTREAAQGAVSEQADGGGFWGAVIGAVGLAAMAGLVGFAVASAMTDLEEEDTE